VRSKRGKEKVETEKKGKKGVPADNMRYEAYAHFLAEHTIIEKGGHVNNLLRGEKGCRSQGNEGVLRGTGKKKGVPLVKSCHGRHNHERRSEKKKISEKKKKNLGLESLKMR